MPTADQMGDSKHGAHERARVLSRLQTHLLPDGSVEYGVACVILGSTYFGDDLQFICISSATQLLSLREEVEVTYFQNLWTIFPARADNGRFVIGTRKSVEHEGPR